jgi:hypothetical protein
MKIAVIILAIFATCLIFIAWLGWDFDFNAIKSLEKADAQISTLNNTLTKTSNENIQLKTESNLKSFTTLKELQRFLKDAKAPKEVTDSTYASETCIALMREAKEKGYWLGITAVNTTDENYWKAYVRDRSGATDIKWHIFNVAVVGDSDLYIIDSQDISNVYFIVSVTGDFQDYNKVTESNVSNLNVH